MMKNIFTIFLLTLTVSCFGQTDGWKIRVGQNQDPDTSNVGVMYPSGNGNLTGRMHFVSYGTLADSISQYISGGANYLVYEALLAQTGTDAPTAVVLTNTLGGTVVWTYQDVGSYVGTLTGAFAGNAIALPSMGVDYNHGLPSSYSVYIDSVDGIGVNSFSDQFTTYSDGILNGLAYIEIRVYNP